MRTATRYIEIMYLLYLYVNYILLQITLYTVSINRILADSLATSSSPSQLLSEKNNNKDSDNVNENTNYFYVENNSSYTFNVSTCILQSKKDGESDINLKMLARLDGKPRYYTVFNVTGDHGDHTWEYSFNPCVSVSLNNPQVPNIQGGDGCLNVWLCKNGIMGTRSYYFALASGTQDSVVVRETRESKEKETKVPTLVFSGHKSLSLFKTHILLICDLSRVAPDEGLFTVDLDNGEFFMAAKLYHRCCCPGGCGNISTNSSKKSVSEKKKTADGELTLVIVGILVGLILLVALIGGLCYVKRTHLQFYSKLPAINPGGINTDSILYTSVNGKPSTGQKNSDFRDYEPASISSARKKMIPVLADCVIKMEQVEMGQRLGGGIFGDTHLGKWNEMTVTVKRLTLAIHDNQLTTKTMEWMQDEVWFLSRQRHKNIVCILGLCLNGRLPFLLTEYVIGECLKDFIKVNGKLLTWPQRIRLCGQVADGMGFLHSTKPPIIHRDLRCGNLFLSDNDLVKVADFALIKLLQPMREQCNSDDCGCQRQLSACPATVRWTAPEILTHPKTKEGENGIISPAVDVYSFGMVMWELVHCKDPFDEIGTELEVIEIVRNGGRPDTPPSYEMMPQYKDLMKSCWDQRPNTRPPFKQVAVKLKEFIPHARSYQKHINSKSRTKKLNDSMDQV